MKVKSMHWESQWLANASHDVGFTGFRSTQHTLPCVMQTLCGLSIAARLNMQVQYIKMPCMR